MRVTKKDFDWAAGQGIIGQDQAAALWQALDGRAGTRSRFDLVHVAYYAGALLVIGAMGWFMSSVWEAFGGLGIFLIAFTYALVFLIAGDRMWRRDDLRIPGGLLVTMAVAMTPLAVYGLQRELGLWGFDDPGEYKEFHRWIRGGWFAMEVATLVTGGLAFARYRFPFLTAAIAFVLWYVSMDLTPVIAGGDIDWDLRRLVSLWFGLAIIIASYAVDRCWAEDFAFWGYLFGGLAFWCGLTLMDSGSELGKLIYFLINIGLMGLSVFLRRRVFLVFGAFGVIGYLGHLAFDLFEDSALFPVVLTVAGLCVIWLGVQLKRHGPRLVAAVESAFPDWMIRLRPPERGVVRD